MRIGTPLKFSSLSTGIIRIILFFQSHIVHLPTPKEDSPMAYPLITLRCCLALLLLASAGYAQADAGKELFEAKWASCHTIGGGDGVGPDLKGVGARRSTDWLVLVITEPDQLTARKDPAQLELTKKFGMKMPKLGISRDDALKILTFLHPGATQPSAKEVAPPEPGAAKAPAAGQKRELTAATKELISTGLALFTGKEPFAKGGAPCVSCHSLRYSGINGGTLAADLTELYSKMGDGGVRGVLKSLGFPVMKNIYAQRPLNDDEATALVALFKDASARKQTQCDPFLFAGLGFLALFMMLTILFQRRIK
jgi:mono/diheme cytochrome c family protein